MNIRNNKGITLMAEVMTVVLLIIIVSIITYSSKSSLQIRDLNNMYSDIVSIQEKAINYYLKYGEAPVEYSQESIVSSEVINAISDQKNPNDEVNEIYNYYKVDISKLDNTTLNNKQTEEDYYFMNTKTLTVYYSKGVTINNDGNQQTYYTLPSNYEGIEVLNVSDYQD